MIITEDNKKKDSPFRFKEINGITVNTDFIPILELNGLLNFQKIMNFDEGKLYRENKRHRVSGINLKDSSGKNHLLFLKRHRLTVNEMLRSLFNRGNAESGHNEWDKILLFHSIGIPTMVPIAYGEIQRWSLPWVSMTITENINNAVSLEQFIPDNFSGKLSAENVALKRNITLELASIVRRLHDRGLNHQDLYLCHFFIRTDPFKIFMIDLQRVNQRNRISYGRKVKDLAQLYYSSTVLKGINRSDRLRFFKSYLKTDRLRKADTRLIKMIKLKSNRISRHTDKIYGMVSDRQK